MLGYHYNGGMLCSQIQLTRLPKAYGPVWVNSPFGVLRDHVEEIFVVEEEEILAAMRMAFERLHLVLEPSSAVALAPLLRGESFLANRRVGVILSGGNISLPDFFWLVDQHC